MGPRSLERTKGLNCLEFNLGLPPELGPDVNCFLQEVTSNTREDIRSDSSPEPPVEEYKRWVTWQGQALDMPDWWQELVEIPEVDDYWELAQKIWASFNLLQQMSKLHDMENYYLAPLTPPCLCQKDFLLPPNPKFPCWDIREGQLEKTVAYAQALQFLAEKSNLPTPGQLCLLVGSILELREMMEPYVSFFDDAVLDGVAPSEGFLKDQSEETIPESAQPASTNPPLKRPLQKKQPLLGASGGTNYSPETMQGTNHEGRGLPNSVSWVERSIASLQASYHCWTGPSSLLQVKMEASQPEFWGKEGSMPKGRRLPTS